MIKREMIKKISLFFILFLTSSFVICNDIWSSTVTICLWILVLAMLLFNSQIIDKKLAFIMFLLVISMGISTLINHENFRTYVALSFSYFVILLFVSQYNISEFIDSYVYVLKLICVISLIGYMAFLIVPELHNFFVVTNLADLKATNLVLYIDTANNKRNMGMFWEPGAFQTFINLALMFEVSKENPNKINVVIFVLTVLTTYSTTGYIGLLFIGLLFFVRKGTNIKAKIVLLVLAIAFMLIIFFNGTINSLLFASSINGQSTVFGKIIQFFNGNRSSVVLDSASVRYNAIFEIAKTIKEKPILGYGYSGLRERTYEYTYGMNTCTFLNWFATYGILFGIVALIGSKRFSEKLNVGFLARVTGIMILFILTMSENYVNNAMIVMIILYGYRENYAYDKEHNNRRL